MSRLAMIQQAFSLSAREINPVLVEHRLLYTPRWRERLRLDHILFPVDFSEQCAKIADHVMGMARSNRSKVTLLHVLECPPSWYSDIEAARLSSHVDLDVMKQHRQEQLSRFLERQFHDLAPLRV